MAERRDHTPSRTLGGVVGLGEAFAVQTARMIVQAVGLPIIATDLYSPVVAPDADLPFAQLAQRLNSAAFDWGWSERQQTGASPKMKAALAQSVAAKCAGLLATLVDNDGELKTSLRGGGLWAQAALEGADSGEQAVREAMASINALARWSEAVALRASRAAGNGGPDVRQGDKALQTLISDLGGIYSEFWRRAPGVSRDPNAGTPTGPFLRFAGAVSNHLGLGKTDEALATLIKRNPAISAMRTTWTA